ncbi:twin-arginine translocation signal domain-containing protein [Chitinibacter bivalviorum]|uniref:Twin-arginine translocation signal domain-containing protein n=1 Tax=Chitinibacter bivalviorum TaxID=2739434 RepID=A0A7H9BN17_9NEIS|nr:twin-arginine translocation signal domain-containing protein [Chitinibacter bivalviorum]
MSRRQFLQTSAALGLATMLPACRELSHLGIPIKVYLPGMQSGHGLRQHTSYPAPSSERKVGVAILGSGAAGSFAAWRLKQSGRFTSPNDVVIVSGPERFGNAAAGTMNGLAYPLGAHYLPLPSLASRHVRELLFDMGVIESDPYSEKPTYNETVLIHSPEERILLNRQWQDGVVPRAGISQDELAQQQKFFAYTQSLQHALGNDGRKVFSIPLALSSVDPAWRALDQISFATWLTQHGYTAPSLLWYLDYACRDDYGIGIAQTSAWAGLHYFTARGGEAKNASAGAVLTWPSGLNPILQHLQHGQTLLDGMAVKISKQNEGVQIDVFDGQKTTRLIAEHLVCAMPLHVAAKIIDLKPLGFDPALHLAPHAAWQVSNFLIDRFPAEPAQMPLAWDNVVYGSSSLGFVNSTHQLIRIAKPAQTVFTAYHAYAHEQPAAVRHRLEHASAAELYETAIADLDAAYGWGNPIKARQYIKQVEITLRGHAMASPTVGFLSNQGVAALQKLDGRIQFAHSDLSGLSVFEEASWWGEQAALKILKQSA